VAKTVINFSFRSLYMWNKTLKHLWNICNTF